MLADLFRWIAAAVRVLQSNIGRFARIFVYLSGPPSNYISVRPVGVRAAATTHAHCSASENEQIKERR